MGSDDLFSKRKERSAASLKRVNQTRVSAMRYLIVCEGSKTEPQYFQAMVTAFGINAQHVKIAPNDGNTPDRVLSHALGLYGDDYKLGDPFDQVYCVFDRDAHSTFEAVIAKIKDLKAKGKPFNAITSTPCFEYWLLLHFGFTDKAFTAVGRKSAGDAVVSALKKHKPLTAYAKGQVDIYELVRKNTLLAIAHARRNRKNAEKTGSLNPWTNVDVLVEEIEKLRTPQIL
jgi:RloB-like protein